MHNPLEQTWELDSIFPGGSGSAEFASFMDRLEKETAAFRDQLHTIGRIRTVSDAAALAPVVETMQRILAMVREAESFTACLVAENQNDRKAVQLSGRVKSAHAAYLSALTRFDQLLRETPDAAFAELLERQPFREVAFPLEERRRLAAEKLPPEQEALLADVAVDGYHGWGDLYDTIVGSIKIPADEDGKPLSVGQAFNRLHTPDRSLREKRFKQWEETWADHADFCAEALNRLAGFRLQMYKHRGWDSVHKEPLAINRMSGETLDAMWQAVTEGKADLVRYMNRKAKLFGLERLAWHDTDAPLGKSSKHVSYDEGAQMIVRQFRRFSPKMADFAEKAFEDRWIEAEDRPGKRPGGFCTSFPIKEQTRIFMTYGGTMNNVSTLAHELGHGYHQHVMNDMPPLCQQYAMNVAETASTLAEMIVSDAAVKRASDPEEKLSLVEDKIQRAVAFFMNIHSRFLFETRFYDERRKGLVGVDRLNELMVEAQHEAYCGALSDYHPHFWAAKLHFYITDVPFYNFPYTFGYMFSAGIYARALQEGEAFEDRYVALLRDTGRLTVEQLAKRHLDVDLTKPDFWRQAVALQAQDIRQFLQMTE